MLPKILGDRSDHILGKTFKELIILMKLKHDFRVKKHLLNWLFFKQIIKNKG